MTTGFTEFAEDSSEEPYSKGLNEIAASHHPLDYCCSCVAHRELSRPCNPQPAQGPVSKQPLLVLSPLDSTTDVVVPSVVLVFVQSLVAYLSAFAPRNTPIDGIRPTKTPTCADQPPKPREQDRWFHCDTLCQGVNVHAESDELIITHQSSPEEFLCSSCCKNLCIVLYALLCSRPLARFNTSITSGVCRLDDPQSPNTTYHRPSNVATYIELPTLRPLCRCY